MAAFFINFLIKMKLLIKNVSDFFSASFDSILSRDSNGRLIRKWNLLSKELHILLVLQ